MDSNANKWNGVRVALMSALLSVAGWGSITAVSTLRQIDGKISALSERVARIEAKLEK